MIGSAETANAKLNLALHVRERRADGYHRIETVFAFCEDGDRLSAEPTASLSIEVTGPMASALEATENIVLDAAQALRSVAGIASGAALFLDKRLPVASGLGGGSADAAAALRLLNRLWKIGWSEEKLSQVGSDIGADVPACVYSRPMRGEGRGDELRPVDLDLSGTPVLLVNPRVRLSTAEIFKCWDGADRGPLDDWRHGRNDLEPAARSLAPQIGSILAWLSAQPGAHCVRMSGSGPTCFALFESDSQRDRAATAVPREWWQMASRLR